MAPDPFNSSRALSLRTPPLPVRCNTLPNRFQRAVRNGLRAAGAAAFTGGAVTLAGAGSRPLGLKYVISFLFTSQFDHELAYF